MAAEDEGRGLTPGTLIGERYQLERKLGTGGMASVWLARDERTGREVAVKVLADVLAHEPDYVRRFRREAEIAAGFDHPNVVGVVDSGRAGGRPYLVMEHVPGGTLADRLAAGKPQDPGRLAEELLGGLAHIHAAGVVHRDVKPQNVLLTGHGRAKLTDFGIARPEDASRITRTGEVIGTLSYMAPEVQRGEPATVRSDLYACGKVLRECAGPSPPTALATLVTMLTAEHPDDRPGSADQALSVLEHGGVASTQTAPTRRMGAGAAAAAPAAGPGERRFRIDPRWALAGAVALAAAVLLLLLLPGGGDEAQRSGAGGDRAPAAMPEPPATAQDPAPGAAGPQEGAVMSCDALEDRRDRLKESEKAAEERVKDDDDAREAVRDRFDAREEALKEEIEACKEAEKAEGGEDDEPGDGGD